LGSKAILASMTDVPPKPPTTISFCQAGTAAGRKMALITNPKPMPMKCFQVRP
jgi:hypothetical protein